MDVNQLRTKIEPVYAKLADLNYYEILEVGQDATEDQIKSAYRSKAKVYHVDSYPGVELGELRQKMQRIFGEVSKAHSTLCDKDAREEYNAMLALTAAGVPTDIKVIFAADEAFKAGKRLADRGSYASAYAKLREATAANRSEPDFWAYLFWCEYCLLETDKTGQPATKSAVSRIEAELSKFAGPESRCDAANLFLGHIAKSKGDLAEAKRQYQFALEKRPDNLEANSSLRLLNQRQQKSGNIFSRFFSKK